MLSLMWSYPPLHTYKIVHTQTHIHTCTQLNTQEDHISTYKIVHYIHVHNWKHKKITWAFNTFQRHLNWHTHIRLLPPSFLLFSLPCPRCCGAASNNHLWGQARSAFGVCSVENNQKITKVACGVCSVENNQKITKVAQHFPRQCLIPQGLFGMLVMMVVVAVAVAAAVAAARAKASQLANHAMPAPKTPQEGRHTYNCLVPLPQPGWPPQLFFLEKQK